MGAKMQVFCFTIKNVDHYVENDFQPVELLQKQNLTFYEFFVKWNLYEWYRAFFSKHQETIIDQCTYLANKAYHFSKVIV